MPPPQNKGKAKFKVVSCDKVRAGQGGFKCIYHDESRCCKEYLCYCVLLSLITFILFLVLIYLYGFVIRNSRYYLGVMSVSAIGCDILVKCSLDYAERKYYFHQYGTK